MQEHFFKCTNKVVMTSVSPHVAQTTNQSQDSTSVYKHFCLIESIFKMTSSKYLLYSVSDTLINVFGCTQCLQLSCERNGREKKVQTCG